MIIPEWSAPKNVHAFVSTLSEPGNIATHVNDDPNHVAENRKWLSQHYQWTTQPLWLNQTHQNRVITPDEWHEGIEADGSYADKKNNICVVLTADCLPILLCSDDGTEIAALHAGWRSLASGIIQSGLQHFKSAKTSIHAWLGPCIQQCCFEVGNDVHQAFDCSEHAFTPKPSTPGKWYGDLQKLASIKLENLGLNQITQSTLCTYCENKLLYSHRRDKHAGRMGSFIWLEN